jgi:hypothetical protein
VGGEEADTTGCTEQPEDEEEQPDAHRPEPLDGEDPAAQERLLVVVLRLDDGPWRTPEHVGGEADGGATEAAQQGHGVLRGVVGWLMTVCVPRAAGLIGNGG